jgi:hypothetical protein
MKSCFRNNSKSSHRAGAALAAERVGMAFICTYGVDVSASPLSE